MNMMPVLLPSTLSSIMLQPQPIVPDQVSVIRGRKRTNENADGHYFSKRNANSDVSDDDASTPRKGSPNIDDDRRAHHNELERKRRDHIKDHFMYLKEAIPLLEGEKSSRALILKRAVEYISLINQRVAEQALIIEELQRKNDSLHKDSRTSPVTSVVPLMPAVLPTTSTATVAAPKVEATATTVVVPTTAASSFSPVIPAPKPAAPAPVVPRFAPQPAAAAAAAAGPTMADLAMLIALQQQQQQQHAAAAAAAAAAALKPVDSQTLDLAALLSLNSLKEQTFVSPLLF